MLGWCGRRDHCAEPEKKISSNTCYLYYLRDDTTTPFLLLAPTPQMLLLRSPPPQIAELSDALKRGLLVEIHLHARVHPVRLRHRQQGFEEERVSLPLRLLVPVGGPAEIRRVYVRR